MLFFVSDVSDRKHINIRTIIQNNYTHMREIILSMELLTFHDTMNKKNDLRK